MAATMDMEAQNRRPRTKSRTFSFMSDKSRESKNSAKASYRESMKETPAEKRRSHFTTKANPTIAINEAQPVALALEAPTLASLRSIQHMDSFGNPIAEPDLSNPTRPRWERPLDTIRSFEAAIDTEYKRRSMMRTETAPADYHGYNSRRSSYYGDQNPRYSQAGGYYGTRTPAARESYPDNSYGAPPVPAHGRPPRPGPRMYSENGANRYSTSYNNQSAVYPTQAYQQSRDTVNTGGSSGSEPWANNTDPSSDNSSLERVTPLTKPETGDQYGFAGFGGAPILEEYGSSSVSKKPVPTPGSQHNNNQPGGYFQQQHPAALPAVPPKYAGNSRPGPNQRGSSKLIRLSQAQQAHPLAATSGNVPPARKALPANPEKRKSWFMRRFSSKD